MNSPKPSPSATDIIAAMKIHLRSKVTYSSVNATTIVKKALTNDSNSV